MQTVVDTIKVISVVDSSFMSQVDSLALSAFGGGAQLALTACFFSAAAIMLGVGIHRAIGP